MSHTTLQPNWNWFRWIMVGVALTMLILYVKEYDEKPFQFWAWAIMLAIWFGAAVYKTWIAKTP